MRHPSAPLLERHALGDLPLPAWLAVDAHVETCSHCATIVSAAEEVEGQRLAEVAPIDLTTGLLDRVMAALDAPAPLARAIVGDVALPRAVAEAGVGRRRWLGPGMWTAFVHTPADDGWRAFILRTPAGAVVPMHGHEGQEMITVLAGSLTDGVRYKAGDFAEIKQGDEHGLRAGPSGPCVCLIAVEGAYRWKGMARFVAPLLGV